MNKQMDSKLFRAAAVLLCAGGLMVSSAIAQQPQDGPPPPDGQMQGPPPGGHEGRGNPEHHVEMLQKHLGLTDDQAAQAKTIYANQWSKAEAVRTNTALAPHDRRTQMMAIHEDAEAKIHAILTPEQKTKYDAMEARMHDHHHGGPDGPRPGEDGPPPPPAPQQ
jgi:protein CpxP